MITWYLAVSVTLFLLALVWTVQRWRVDARRSSSAAARTERCSRCGELLPSWFQERFPTDGVFAPLGSDAREAICRHCTEAWPYPEERESEDGYVERLKAWMVERGQTPEHDRDG